MNKVIIPILLLAMFFVTGCKKTYPYEDTEESGSHSVQTIKHIEVIVNQTGEDNVYFNEGEISNSPVGIRVDGEPFEIWSTGMFENDAYDPVYGVELYQAPQFGTCTLFEKWTDRNAKMITCVPNGAPKHDVQPWNQNAVVDIGNGWAWGIRDGLRVMYNAENNFDLNATRNEENDVNFVHSHFPQVLSGTFFDSSDGNENYYKYLLPGNAISNNSKLEMDTAMLQVIKSNEQVLQISRVYTHETDFYYETEYVVTISSTLSSAEMIAELAQVIHGAVMEADGTPGHPLVYVPSSTSAATKTKVFRVGTIVGPFGSNSLLGVQVSPESIMGDSHFPTILGASN